MARHQRENNNQADRQSAYVPAAQIPPSTKKAKKRGPWFVVFIIALIVLIVSLVALGVVGYSYFQGQQKYDSIATEANFDTSDIESKDLSEISVDWDALRATNPDIVAWVYIPNTNINYPVVQGQDNDYYLTHDFEGTQGWLANYGCIFLDYTNAPDFSDKVNFIYGHHMNDGSMFADIAGMTSQDRFDECRTVYLFTPEGNYRLRSFSLIHCNSDDPIVQTTFSSTTDFANYYNDKIARSEVDVADAPTADQAGRIFALATCDSYGSGRYVLYCSIVDTSVSSDSLGSLVNDINSEYIGS